MQIDLLVLKEELLLLHQQLKLLVLLLKLTLQEDFFLGMINTRLCGWKWRTSSKVLRVRHYVTCYCRNNFWVLCFCLSLLKHVLITIFDNDWSQWILFQLLYSHFLCVRSVLLTRLVLIIWIWIWLQLGDQVLIFSWFPIFRIFIFLIFQFNLSNSLLLSSLSASFSLHTNRTRIVSCLCLFSSSVKGLLRLICLNREIRLIIKEFYDLVTCIEW